MTQRDSAFVDWRTAVREPKVGTKYRVGNEVWVKIRTLGQKTWTGALATAHITIRFMGLPGLTNHERLVQDVRNMGYVPESEVPQ